MIQCIAIDDEPLALELIKQYCSANDRLNLLDVFTNTEDAKELISNQQIDLVFLDIQMPELNGLDFYNQYCKGKLVIFTTAYSDYAVKGFELKAVDYLMKPFNKARFDQAIEKAERAIQHLHALDEKEKRFITVKSEYKLINLTTDQIMYIVSKDDYVKIYLSDGKFIMSKTTTASMEEKLNLPGFFRIHRSYIINSAFVSKINTNAVVIGDLELPIGKKYKKEVLEKWNTYK